MNNKMNKNKRQLQRAKVVPLEHSVEMRYLYQVAGLRSKKLLERFPNYSNVTVYKHAKKAFNASTILDRRRQNKGRLPKLTEQDARILSRTIPKLRKMEGSFTSKRIQLEAGLMHVSNRTVRRKLNELKYKYCRSRKKSLLLSEDLKIRLKYCREIKKKNLGQEYWNSLSFFLDGTGFIYKQNPMDQALTPKAREWHKPNEGLNIGCTAKGKKEGSIQAKYMVAISYHRGVVMCEQYEGGIDGKKFARMAGNCFPQAFALSINPYERNFLQDGDPSQNSKPAQQVFENMGATVVSIPPRSPDLNPIENFFNLIGEEIQKDTKAKKITRETFDEFSTRVRGIIVNYPIRKIDKIIESMDKRINLVIEVKGNRIKY